MSGVHVTKTTALYPNGVFVQWDIDSEESGPFLVDVVRSGSPQGPWEVVATAMRNAYSYLDNKFNLPPGIEREGVNQFSLSRVVYYRVTVVPPSGIDHTFESEPTPVEPHLDRRTRLLKRKIQRDQAVGYKRLNGIPLVVLKRRRWGDRCNVCYDPSTKQATHEHCPTCYGTSFVGGYWTPVAIRGRREAAATQAQMAGHGDSEAKIADFNVLDYPLIEYKDVIIDLVRNDRYEVQRVHTTELKSVPVHQKVTASLLGRNSVEYSVLADPLTTPSLY